jgi:hypothetical protein
MKSLYNRYKLKKRKNNKSPTKKKKESRPDLECYKRIERHEMWIAELIGNLTWRVLRESGSLN